jgi:hypothetical protein
VILHRCMLNLTPLRPAETKLEAELASAGDDIGAIYRR